MMNDDDDIDVDDFENDDDLGLDEGSFDDFGEKEGSLGALLRENPMAKIGAVIAGAIVIFILVSVLGGKKDVQTPSLVAGGADVKAAPGESGVSEAMKNAIVDSNIQRVEDAELSGGSALPTPVDPPVGKLSVPEREKEEEDPLQRWRKLQQERLERELEQQKNVAKQQQQVVPVPVDDSQRTQAIQAMADVMSEQMQAILESKSETNIQQMSITDPSWLEDLFAEEEEAQAAAAAAAAKEAPDDTQETLLPAGEILYAQLLTEANSDIPGPVLAHIVSGPLSGSRALGSFEVRDEYLSLSFTSVVLDGKTVPVNAVALDPETTLPGMATEVDHRYLQRVILPAAAAFVEGAANAISETGLTTVTVSGDTVAEESQESDTEQEIASGLEEAGQELRDILDETAESTKVLVRIEAGTPMGLLFVDPVVVNKNVEN